MVKVKICGITRPEDGAMVSRLGADMAGVILVERSRRRVSFELAAEIFKEILESTARVAVLMPSTSSELSEADARLRPDFIQLHPSLPIDEIEKVKKSLRAGVILVVPIPLENPDEAQLLNLAVTAAEVADFILLDTKGQEGGGTGKPHDWSISRKIRNSIQKPVFLAGGLTPENVREAIKAVQPQGVDVATGVERGLGVKDSQLVEKFIRAAKGLE